MNNYILGYRHPSIKLYKPKVNKVKRNILIGFILICLITPCTNWLIPLTLKGLTKLNPLFIYQ